MSYNHTFLCRTFITPIVVQHDSIIKKTLIGYQKTEEDILQKEKQIEIKFDDEKIAWYDFTDLDQIEHSYAITIHKAQRKRI